MNAKTSKKSNKWVGYDWMGYQAHERKSRNEAKREERFKRRTRARHYPSEAHLFTTNEVFVDGRGRTYTKSKGGQLIRTEYPNASHPRRLLSELSTRPSRSKYSPVLEDRKHNINQ